MPSQLPSAAAQEQTIESDNMAFSTQFLGQSGEFWDSWLIVSGFFAALAALAIGLTTTGSVIAHKREAAAAERELDRFKTETAGKIAEANRRTETERLERVKLELKIAPRRLSSEQKSAIVSQLSSILPPPPIVAVVSRLLDAEGGDFADDLSAAIDAAGWRSVRYMNWTGHNKGLFVSLAEGSSVSSNDLYILGLTGALVSTDLKPSFLLIKKTESQNMSPYFQPNVIYISL